MKVVIENFDIVSDEKLMEYDDLGIEPTTYLKKRELTRGETVLFYLNELKYSSIDSIGYCLATGHPVGIKYKNVQYNLHDITEWRNKIQDPKDQIREIVIKHPILLTFEEKRRQKNLEKRNDKLKERTETICVIELPEDVDDFLRAFAPRYNVPYSEDMPLTDKYLAYQSIKYYLDNNIEYSNPAPVIDVEDSEVYFLKFNTDIKTDTTEPEIESFGDEIYFEDCVNKSLQLDLSMV